MQDKKYCYPNSNVLKNKLNIKDENTLFEAEKKLTLIRLQELQTKPIEGNFDFKHLKDIHHYIFQDVYSWAGELRTVEIGKGNLFCTTEFLLSYGESIFENYFRSCFDSKDYFKKFVKIFSSCYADLNALHPFREGNGRTQREFARLVCMECGYVLDLSCTTHNEMLKASIESFDTGNNSKLEKIFFKAIIPVSSYKKEDSKVNILSLDDLVINITENINNYQYTKKENLELIEKYNSYYSKKIKKQ